MVVSTTGADRPIVSLEDYRQHVARRRHQRPLFILDLAMPRDFDPAIREELGVYLYGIDDLTEACERNRAERSKELPAAEAIVDEETRRFVAEARHRATGPVIARFREGLEKSQSAELERLFTRLPDLDERSRARDRAIRRPPGGQDAPPAAGLAARRIAERPAPRPLGSAAAALPAQRLRDTKNTECTMTNSSNCRSLCILMNLVIR